MKRTIIFLSILFLLISSNCYSAYINGSSALLTQNYANQLETWLNEGPITLTRIFSKSINGSSSSAFHNNVDGKGRTFSLIKVDGGYDELIGGYNPTSWDTSTNYRHSLNTGDYSAFIFNLTENRIHRQIGNKSQYYQTYNNINYGPTFGGGHAIYVNANLSSGYTITHYTYNLTQNLNGYYTYGGGDGRNILGDAAYYDNGTGPGNTTHSYSYNLVYGDIETFTIQTGVPIPEVNSFILIIIVITGFIWIRSNL